MVKLYKYKISADGGKTWTEQWLSETEAKKEQSAGLIVQQLDPRLFYKEV